MPALASKIDEPAGHRDLAEHALMDGRVDEAVRMLQAELSADGNNGRIHLLLCRAYYSETQVDPAVQECASALLTLSNSSEAQDWMGRAYGVKANNSGPISGFKLARKVHDAFEAAFALDPHSVAAANDLGEYYASAPAVVGGGLDKADALANKVEAELPQAAHRIRAMAAEKRKDYGTAEREFQAAVDVAHRPDAWVDLGGFYARRNQKDRAVTAFKRCIAADRAKDASIVDVASYLIDMQVEPGLALQELRQYLAGDAKSDAAPAVRVHVLMSKLLLNGGDSSGSKIEVEKALQLAADYPPAKSALLTYRGH